MHMPRPWHGAGWNEVVNPTSLRYKNELVMPEQEIDQTKEILISGWTLPGSEASAYQELVSRARTNVTTTFARTFLGRLYPASSGRLSLSRRQWFRWLWFALWAGYLAYVFFRPASP
jgi:hypothetical protein